MMRPFSLAVAATLLSMLVPQSVSAQGFGIGSDPTPSGKGPRLDKQSVERMEVGVRVTASGGPCKGIAATTPIPMDWPEQKVKVVAEDFNPSVKNVNYRMLNGTVKQMTINMPFIPPGDNCQAIVTIEITRHTLLAPEDTTIYRIPSPKKLPASVRGYLGPSPQIECNHAKIRALAKEIAGEKVAKADKQAPADPDAPALPIVAAGLEVPLEASEIDPAKRTDWQRVEAIYDWVRAHIEYKNGPLKSSIQALKDGFGDCEELSDVFIAICRASDIPARIVWVPGHCYPEFYLEDAEGHGYWFPCQAAGNREFGGISETRPILQKGDNFQVPERKDRQRYVAEHLTGAGGQPQVEFIRRMTGGA